MSNWRITQGPYRHHAMTSAHASAGTHDTGGVVDLGAWGEKPQQQTSRPLVARLLSRTTCRLYGCTMKGQRRLVAGFGPGPGDGLALWYQDRVTGALTRTQDWRCIRCGAGMDKAVEALWWELGNTWCNAREHASTVMGGVGEGGDRLSVWTVRGWRRLMSRSKHVSERDL